MSKALSQVIGIVLLDSDGERIAAKYGGTADDRNFRDMELQLSLQAVKSTAAHDSNDFMLYHDCVVIFGASGDTVLYVIGDPSENELLLQRFFLSVQESLTKMFGGTLTKKQILESLDSVFLLFDEAVEGRIIFENSPTVFRDRLHMVTAHEGAEDTTSAFNQALSSARETILRGLLSGS